MRLTTPAITGCLCLGLLAGCTSTTGGNASPAAGGAPTSATSSATTVVPTRTSQASRPPVARPSVVDVGTTDPCSLVTDAQRASLGLDARPSGGPDPVTGGRVCAFGSRTESPFFGILVTVNKSATDFAGSNVSRTSTPTTVSGFPAYVVTQPTDPNGCLVAVDVADGQLFETQRDDRTGTPLDQICSAAQSFAETAVANLLTQK